MPNNEEKLPVLFPVTVFKKLDDNGVITKARVRIFYKYENRNGGYITDTFADKLLTTLPGSPVKGIYNQEDKDFTTHGKARTSGRAYGFVPETNHNIAYEDHEDEDGVTRTYACADVFLWTALYEEAGDIIGAPQSMELYEPSIKGTWKLMNGQRRFEYTEGSFLGLQALGQNVEPCFEGAAFFSLFTSLDAAALKSLYEAYLNFQARSQIQEGGKEDMFTFKLSDSQKANKIFQALNPNEEYRYYVFATYDDCAIAFDYKEEKFVKVNYTKDDATDTVTVGEPVTVYAEYVTEEERTSLNAIRAIKGTYTATLEEINTVSAQLTSANENLATQALKIQEADDKISTLNTEKGITEASLATATAKVGELETQVNSLCSYKEGVELAEKKAIIAQYSEQLDKGILDSFTEDRLKDFTAVELEKEIAFTLVKSNPSVFTKAPQYIPKDNDAPTGLEAVLDKYRNRKN